MQPLESLARGSAADTESLSEGALNENLVRWDPALDQVLFDGVENPVSDALIDRSLYVRGVHAESPRRWDDGGPLEMVNLTTHLLGCLDWLICALDISLTISITYLLSGSTLSEGLTWAIWG